VIWVAAVLAACGSSAAAPAPSATAHGGCPPAGARTLAATPGARVYSQDGFVYACAPRSGRRYRLGVAAGCLQSARVGPAAAAGGIVAYAAQRCGVDTISAFVIVRRLSDGRQVFSRAAAPAAIGPEAAQSVGSIVVDRGGAAAWITVQRSIVSRRYRALVCAAVGSGVRVLDAGSAIRVRSLRLRGRRLTWRDGASLRSANFG
jgi:hypothetical protein